MKQNSNNAIPGLELSTNLQAVTYDKVYWQYITLSKLITQVIQCSGNQSDDDLNHFKEQLKPQIVIFVSHQRKSCELQNVEVVSVNIDIDHVVFK